MTTIPPAPRHVGMAADGGVAAYRAILRWAWRLLRHEWRRQFLIFALITVAVAGTIVGSAVATNDPQPTNSGFGTAQDLVSFTTHDAQTASIISRFERRFGRVEVIDNATQSIPGSTGGGIAALGNVPVVDLLFVLLGIPAFAAIVAWLLGGRQPVAMARQAIE